MRMFDEDEASKQLGMELLSVGDGRAVVRMTITASMVNGHAIAHGGYVFLLADTAFACACNSHGPVTAVASLGDKSIVVAAGADITFARPAHQGDVLTAYAEERTRFGRSGIYDVTVKRGDDVVAEFRGRSRSVDR